MKARLLIGGDIVMASLDYIDDKTYSISMSCFSVIGGRFDGEKVVIATYGGKFIEWVEG